jgi:nucleotide-binding universal stress UspA family protein
VIGATKLETIVVPIDFSKPSRQAFELARDLAREAGPAHVILVHACFVPVEIEALVGSAAYEAVEDIDTHVAKELDQLVAELKDGGVSCEAVTVRGSPENVILDLAESKRADLIVMGTHGRTGLSHFFLGSVAERVVRNASCPVMTASVAR